MLMEGKSDTRGRARQKQLLVLARLRRDVCFAAFWVALVIFFILGLLHRVQFSAPSSPPAMDQAQPRLLQPTPENGTSQTPNGETFNTKRDKYLGGLLIKGMDTSSCHSRYEAVKYRQPSPHKPSSYFVKRLRQYEDYHHHCQPFSHGYNNTILSLLNSNSSNTTSSKCKYLLYVPSYGLGNKIITLVSSFLYAILTNRVLLIDRAGGFSNLFCQPFPNSSWVVPEEFPLKNLYLYKDDPNSYGYLIKQKGNSTNSSAWPSFVYAHLESNYGEEDASFFFEEAQRNVKEVPWLLIRSDIYYAAGLFLNREFQPEIHKMFPQKSTSFHHLIRYLIHPSNKVWGIIVRYYETYLSAGTDTLGIQIRVVEHINVSFEDVSKQVINCTVKEKLLPDIAQDGAQSVVGRLPKKIKNVIVTTLFPGYAEVIKNMYWEHPAANGELIRVHQPSQEQKQMFGNDLHDMKAWTEMNLLSFSNSLVITAWSTFGYVAQGLGGHIPWILLRPERSSYPDPTSCYRDISMEPCFHSPPGSILERLKEDQGENVTLYVGSCFDVEGGIKVYDVNELFQGK